MTAQLGHILAASLVVAIVFVSIWRRRADRLTAVASGAVAMVVMGMWLGFYDLHNAIASVRPRTLCLLGGMGVLSAVLHESGFFGVTARRLSAFSNRSALRTFVIFCLLTYVFSLFVNNLTTILVVVPMTLRLADRMGLDPRPIVVGEIIASNLGGASSMVGDFPNMLISAEVGLGFTSFIRHMMPPCLVLLAVLLFMMRAASRLSLETRGPLVTEDWDGGDAQRIGVMKRALAVLGVVVIAFVFSDVIGVSPSLIALAGGTAVLLGAGANRAAVLKRVGHRDLAFFFFLFVLVGGVHASGALDLAAEGVKAVSGGSTLVLCMLLMWLAAAITAVLNAGPSTALLLPIFLGLRPGPPHHLLWWALSLGVCAGSSATLTGATAGPVAATMLERHFDRPGGPSGVQLGFGAREYAQMGVPIAFVFLLISSAYVLAIYLF